MTILDEIVENKKNELEKKAPYKDYYLKGFQEKMERIDPPRDFAATLDSACEPCDVRIIAEIKKASPSKGLIRPDDFYPMVIAQTYQSAGAAAISVLTEEKYFLGRLDFLTSIKHHTKIPILRKDFILEDYQIFESRAAGADSLLLIVSLLDGGLLSDLVGRSRELGMEPLVEVHTEDELKRAVDGGARIIGINNRDLKTFKTDTNTTKRLAPMVPEGCTAVSESGINNYADVETLLAEGVHAFLVGEALMREEDMAAKLRELRGVRLLTPEDLGYEKEEDEEDDAWEKGTD